MVNYKNSKIYKLVSDQSDFIYIGCTTKKYLCDRLYHHRQNYKNIAAQIAFYNDAKIILIENCPCNSKDELLMRKQYWIDNSISNKLINNKIKTCICGVEYSEEGIWTKCKCGAEFPEHITSKYCKGCGDEIEINYTSYHKKIHNKFLQHNKKIINSINN